MSFEINQSRYHRFRRTPCARPQPEIGPADVLDAPRISAIPAVSRSDRNRPGKQCAEYQDVAIDVTAHMFVVAMQKAGRAETDV
jgi:hypothetical protein